MIGDDERRDGSGLVYLAVAIWFALVAFGVLAGWL
jgi:hypothetical protein